MLLLAWLLPLGPCRAQALSLTPLLHGEPTAHWGHLIQLSLYGEAESGASQGFSVGLRLWQGISTHGAKWSWAPC